MPIWFLHERIDNGIFIPKYEKFSVIPEDMCTKAYTGPIISWNKKWMARFRLYLTIDTEYYQLMRLHDFFVN